MDDKNTFYDSVLEFYTILINRFKKNNSMNSKLRPLKLYRNKLTEDKDSAENDAYENHTNIFIKFFNDNSDKLSNKDNTDMIIVYDDDIYLDIGFFLTNLKDKEEYINVYNHLICIRDCLVKEVETSAELVESVESAESTFSPINDLIGNFLKPETIDQVTELIKKSNLNDGNINEDNVFEKVKTLIDDKQFQEVFKSIVGSIKDTFDSSNSNNMIMSMLQTMLQSSLQPRK